MKGKMLIKNLTFVPKIRENITHRINERSVPKTKESIYRQEERRERSWEEGCVTPSAVSTMSVVPEHCKSQLIVRKEMASGMRGGRKRLGSTQLQRQRRIKRILSGEVLACHVRVLQISFLTLILDKSVERFDCIDINMLSERIFLKRLLHIIHL